MVSFPDRHSYIGASEVAMALGLSKFKTQKELWLEKRTKVRDFDTNPDFDRGNAMEPVILSRLAEHYGVTLSDQQAEFKLGSFIRCHVDALTHTPGQLIIGTKGIAAIDAKAPRTTTIHKREEQGLSADNILQGLAITHILRSYQQYKDLVGCVFVLWDYNEWAPIPILVEPNDKLWEKVMMGLAAFWQCVTEGAEPTPWLIDIPQIKGPYLGENVLELNGPGDYAPDSQEWELVNQLELSLNTKTEKDTWTAYYAEERGKLEKLMGSADIKKLSTPIGTASISLRTGTVRKHAEAMLAFIETLARLHEEKKDAAVLSMIEHVNPGDFLVQGPDTTVLTLRRPRGWKE